MLTGNRADAEHAGRLFRSGQAQVDHSGVVRLFAMEDQGGAPEFVERSDKTWSQEKVETFKDAFFAVASGRKKATVYKEMEMEQVTTSKASKAKAATISTAGLRVKRETKKRVMQELARINEKEFGKRVKADDLIVLALSLVEAKHIDELQTRSLSNADRLEQQYRDHSKAHGHITKDAFLGRLLNHEIASPSQPTSSSKKPLGDPVADR